MNERPQVTPSFWRGLGYGLGLSLCMWAFIGGLVYSIAVAR